MKKVVCFVVVFLRFERRMNTSTGAPELLPYENLVVDQIKELVATQVQKIGLCIVILAHCQLCD